MWKNVSMNKCCVAWWSWVWFPKRVNVCFHVLLLLTFSPETRLSGSPRHLPWRQTQTNASWNRCLGMGYQSIQVRKGSRQNCMCQQEKCVKINIYPVWESNPRSPGNMTFIHAGNFSYIFLFLLFYSLLLYEHLKHYHSCTCYAAILQDFNTHQIQVSDFSYIQVSTGIHVPTWAGTPITRCDTSHSTLHRNSRICNIWVTNPWPQFLVLGTMSTRAVREI